MKKVLLGTFGAIIFIVIGFIAYFYWAYPAMGPPPDIKVKKTPDRIERGKYLANHVAVCIDCHSTREWSIFSGPVVPGTKGMGGEKFGPAMGFPGTFYAKNITPYNLKNWTDGEIFRAITIGVSKDGSPLFPVMPYLSYNKMAPRDVEAIIAYLRTLEPIKNEPPPSDPNFPVNFIMRTMPKPYDSSEAVRPSPKDVIGYGKYLVTIGACSDCHTPVKKGQPVKGMYMAGGRAFKMPGGTVRSANLTPHDKTGIGRWTRKQFVATFKQYDVPVDSLPTPAERGYQTVMPWHQYAGMKVEDLEAIFAYLQSLEPVQNEVKRFTPRNRTDS